MVDGQGENPSPTAATEQADSMTPKPPTCVNEVMTKPPVSRGDVVRRYTAVIALPGLSTCAQKIVQAGDNRNNKKSVA